MIMILMNKLMVNQKEKKAKEKIKQGKFQEFLKEVEGKYGEK